MSLAAVLRRWLTTLREGGRVTGVQLNRRKCFNKVRHNSLQLSNIQHSAGSGGCAHWRERERERERELTASVLKLKKKEKNRQKAGIQECLVGFLLLLLYCQVVVLFVYLIFCFCYCFLFFCLFFV